MNLSALFKGLKHELVGEDKDIVKLAHNSKEITKGSLFFCLNGSKTKGSLYLFEAIESGCEAVCLDRDEYDKIQDVLIETNISFVIVDDVRDSLGYVCNNFYCANRFDFKLVGITGTNGKTTISFMIANALQVAGYSVAVVGTSGIFINGDMIRGEGLTTPDPIDLYDILSFFYNVDVDFVIMEVSAHALALKKVNGLIFDYGIFTNLTEDHLDFFKDMKTYGNAKESFFNKVKIGVFNVDDNFGEELFKKFNSKKFAVSKSNGDYVYRRIKSGCKIISKSKHTVLKYGLKGEYNAANATEAYAVISDIVQDNRVIKRAFKTMPKINGRYNEFESKNHGKIILDFAHTPDGLEKILTSAKESLKSGCKLISVFGCGGNRDKEKRAIMGKVSGTISDYTIISIDNPRFESAESVMADVERGIKTITNNYNIIMPRENAIRHAFLSSKPGDIIVVSGKGMEPYYEVNGYKHIYREDVVIKTIIERYDKKERV